MLVPAIAGLLGLTLAGWSFVDAFANVTRQNNPTLALRLRPNDPLALANAADQAFLVDPTNPAVRSASERTARRALDGALLNPVAVRLVAVGFDRSPDRMLAALDAAQRLTRHDVATQLLLIETNVARGDIGGALRGYDHILRRKPIMGETLFPILAGAARDPAVTPALQTEFAAGMPWAGFFIDWAVANDQQLATLLPVINSVPSNAHGLSDGRKQSIVKQLADLGDYPAAAGAYRRYRGPGADTNGDFTRASIYAPLDWEVQNGPGIDGAIDAKAGLFHFTLLGDGQGLLLRRLVPVAAGRYRLDATGVMTGASAAHVVARVACATGGAALGSATLHPGIRTTTAIVTVPSACRFIWLTLEGATTADEAVEGQLSRLRVTPIHTTSSTAAIPQDSSQDPS